MNDTFTYANDLLDYSVYDINSGEILRMGKVPDEAHAKMQVGDGEGYVMRALDPTKHYMRGRRVQEYTPEEQAAYADQPHITATWNVARKVWEDLRPKALVDAAALQDIQDQIEAFEAQQARPLREMTTKNTAGKALAKQRLMAIEASIDALRAKMAQYN